MTIVKKVKRSIKDINKVHLTEHKSDYISYCGLDVIESHLLTYDTNSFNSRLYNRDEYGAKLKELTLNSPELCKNCVKLYKKNQEKDDVS